MSEWFERVFLIEKKKKWTGALCFLGGIVSYLIAFLWDGDKTLEYDIALQLGNVLLCGGVLGLLTTVAQAMDIFKEDLEVVLSNHLCKDEYLKRRGDIEDLWKKVSKIIYGNRFETINDELLSAVKEYLPKDKVSYYYRYDVYTSVKWKDNDHGASGKLEVIDVVSFTLVAQSKEEFFHTIKVWTPIKDTNESKYDITEVKLDGKEIESKREEYDEINGEQWRRIEVRLRLAGKDEYPIRYKMTSVYNIKDDNMLGFSAEYIVSDLTVTLSLPKELSATFMSRGTLKEFGIGNSDGDGQLERKYDGIILPRQGYVFALQRKTEDEGKQTIPTPFTGLPRRVERPLVVTKSFKR